MSLGAAMLITPHTCDGHRVILLMSQQTGFLARIWLELCGGRTVSRDGVCSEQERMQEMTDQPSRRDRVAALVHRVVEHLTGLRLRVGALRLLVRRGAIAPPEIEARLVQIEHDVDAAADLAKDLHDARSEAPDAAEPDAPASRSDEV
jgi:hypothetical protein